MSDSARRCRRFLVALAGGLLLATGLVAQPVQASDDRPYFSWNGEPRVPACDTPAVRRAVAGQIASADVDYLGGLAIEDMSHVVETAYTQGRPSPYARRFCEARARMSDGRARRVYYAIMEHSGFVGVSWNLRACVDGLDPWRVYDARCRTVRP